MYSRKMRIICLITLVMLVCSVLSACSFGKKQPLKIGLVLHLEGTGKYSGKELGDGIRLAVEEINSNGGIGGRTVELIERNGKSDPEESKNVFNSMEDSDKPDIYLTSLSNVSVALAPLAEEKQVPFVSLVIGTSSENLIGDRKWVFRAYPIPKVEIQPIVEILQDLKVKKLGILAVNDEFGNSSANILKDQFEKNGGSAVIASFENTATDYKEQIEKIKDNEAIYVVGVDPNLITSFKNLMEEDYQGFKLAPSGATSPAIRSLPQMKGVYVSAPNIYNTKQSSVKEFKEKYESKYGKPLTHYAAKGYDFMKMLAKISEGKKINSREDIRNLLEGGISYSGIFGDIETDKGSHEIYTPWSPGRIVNGEIEYK